MVKTTKPGPDLIVPITFWGYYCCRCGHRWVPRHFEQLERTEPPPPPDDPGPKPKAPKKPPRMCPRCKSLYWSTPKDD